jgi:hypothetical protein
MVLGGMVIIMCIYAWEIGRGGIFMVDYDDGCGVMVFLGCHAGPMD